MRTFPLFPQIIARQLVATALLLLGVGTMPAAEAAPLNPRTTSVQMFHWKWVDVAKECGNWLGPRGFGGVQVSPPSAARNGKNWYDIYQPVDFTDLSSKMGNPVEFEAMIRSCHAAGVRVYVDAVINHMAADAGIATNGAHWDAEALSYPHFSAGDFHPKCDIQRSDYGTPGNRQSVTNCRLSGLPDLDTASSHVQGEIRNYLNMLLDMGVDGFRIDAAKHIQQSELQSIVDSVRHTTVLGESLWITQEAIGDGSVDLHSYLTIGTLNEFKFASLMRATFRNEKGASIAQLPVLMGAPGHWGGTWGLLDSKDATVFVNNWDTERKDRSLNASNHSGVINDTEGTKRYNLANIFMLAWPYGEPQLHSGFNFREAGDDAPTASPFNLNGTPRINQEWDFIHRWPDIANMVAFRNATAGEGVDHFMSGNANQIAFSRGAKGFVAINNDNAPWNQSVKTSLPVGIYCNVVNGTLTADESDCTGDKVTVTTSGLIAISLRPNDGSGIPAIVVYVEQKLP